MAPPSAAPGHHPSGRSRRPLAEVAKLPVCYGDPHGGLVWSVDATGTLRGLAPRTGDPVLKRRTNGEANHFPTPAVADRLMLVPSTDEVVAFDGPAGLPPPPAAGGPA